MMWLQKLSLRTKLISAVLVPLLVIAGFAVRDVLAAQRAEELSDVQLKEIGHQEAVAELSKALSDERAVMYDPSAVDADLAEERAEVDALVEALRSPDLEFEEAALLDIERIYATARGLRAALGDDMAQIRRVVENRDGSEVDTALEAFTAIPEVVLELQVHDVSGTDATEDLTTLVLLQRMRETLAEEGILLQRAIASPDLPPEALLEIQLAIKKSDEAIDTAIDLGRPANRTRILEYLDGAEWGTYQSLRNGVLGGQTTLDPVFVRDQRNRLAQEAESHQLDVLDKMKQDANDLHDSSTVVVWRTIALAVLVLALVAGLLLVIYRSVRSSLNRLEARASEIANVELPNVVRLMRNEGDAAQIPTIDPIPVESDDEIGRLVEAFNRLHTTSIQLAGEQAASRAVVANMFVNLGRRNQKLLLRLLSNLGALEGGETDADRLAMLYEADHLATRMRRNAESLLILAGAQTARVFEQPVAASTLMRSALAEVEGYSRVKVNIVDEVLIGGAYVTDLSHLVAELVENALKFSAPTDEVEVIARFTRVGYILAVVDQGLGMTKEEIIAANRLIARAASLGETPARRLGLFVVGRLAGRHGMSVELMEGIPAGVIVRVRISDAMLASDPPQRIVDERLQPEATSPFANAATPPSVVGAEQQLNVRAVEPVAGQPPSLAAPTAVAQPPRVEAPVIVVASPADPPVFEPSAFAPPTVWSDAERVPMSASEVMPRWIPPSTLEPRQATAAISSPVASGPPEPPVASDPPEPSEPPVVGEPPEQTVASGPPDPPVASDPPEPSEPSEPPVVGEPPEPPEPPEPTVAGEPPEPTVAGEPPEPPVAGEPPDPPDPSEPSVASEPSSDPFAGRRRVAGANLPSSVSEASNVAADEELPSSPPGVVAADLAAFQRAVGLTSRTPNDNGEQDDLEDEDQ